MSPDLLRPGDCDDARGAGKCRGRDIARLGECSVPQTLDVVCATDERRILVWCLE
jgi:hypothetical protein